MSGKFIIILGSKISSRVHELLIALTTALKAEHQDKAMAAIVRTILSLSSVPVLFYVRSCLGFRYL